MASARPALVKTSTWRAWREADSGSSISDNCGGAVPAAPLTPKEWRASFERALNHCMYRFSGRHPRPCRRSKHRWVSAARAARARPQTTGRAAEILGG